MLAIAALFAACETPNDTDLEKNKKQESKPVTIKRQAITGQVTEKTELAATITGKVVNIEGLVNAEVAVLIGKVVGITEDNAVKLVAEKVNSDGTFKLRATGLSPDTRYYYRTILKGEEADGKAVYERGNLSNFWTLGLPVTFTIGDTTAFSMTSTTVSGKIELKATQAYPFTASLFWCKDVTTSAAIVENGTEIPLDLDAEGNFTVQFGPFDYKTTYAYAVKVVVLDTPILSAPKWFVTPELPFEITVNTAEASMIRDTSALFRATYTVNYEPPFNLQFIFVYSEHEGTPMGWLEAGYITENSGWTGGYSWGGNSVMGFCRGLKPSTTYYYAAVAVKLNDDGSELQEVWPGNVKSFTTTASASNP